MYCEPEPGSLGVDNNVQNEGRSVKQSEKWGYQVLSQWEGEAAITES